MTSSVLGLVSDESKKLTIGKADRREGLYIIGATGTGKSTLIENLVLDDIKNDLGVCLLDPHGDLTNAIISRMAFQAGLLNDPTLDKDERKKCEHIKKRLENDAIYIDLADRTHVAPFNLFHCENPTDVFEVENVVSAFLHILHSSFDISPLTSRMNQYFRHIAFLLAHNPNHTILDIPALLTSDTFMQHLVTNVPDFHEQWFWKEFYGKHSKGTRRMEDISMISNKLEELISPVMRPWFGDTRRTINFRTFMDEKKLVFIKLNSQWENLTKILGNIVIAQLLDAAYFRRDIPLDKRKQMNVYVDEFQKFASEDFATLFTEARNRSAEIWIGLGYIKPSERNDRAGY